MISAPVFWTADNKLERTVRPFCARVRCPLSTGGTTIPDGLVKRPRVFSAPIRHNIEKREPTWCVTVP